MLGKDNITKVLEAFFHNPFPEGGFQLRELSRNVGLAPKSVKIYLEELKRERLIIVKNHRIHGYPIYYANMDDDYFKFLKTLNAVRNLKESGLVDFLYDECMPDCLILFGSASRGEDVKESDLDIYLQCGEKKLELKRFEKILNRKIALFFEVNFSNLSNELKSNIINGIKLRGYLNIKWKG